MAAILANPTCKKFVAGFFSSIKELTGNAPYKTDFLQLFDEVKEFVRNDNLGAGNAGEYHGLFVNKNATITLNTKEDYPGTFNAIEYAAFHEIVHPDGTQKGYSHYDMARAAWAVGDLSVLNDYMRKNGPTENANSAVKDSGFLNSQIFDQLFFAACPPPKPK